MKSKSTSGRCPPTLTRLTAPHLGNAKLRATATGVTILSSHELRRLAFSFPGTGRSGDLAPRSECAPLWRQRLLDEMQQIKLTLVIGDYAKRWHLPDAESKNVTDKP